MSLHPADQFLHIDREGKHEYFEKVPSIVYHEAYDRFLKMSMEQMKCSLNEEGHFTVVDFGTSNGRQLFLKFSELKEQVWAKFGKNREILLILEDIAFNVLNSFWEYVKGEKNITFLTSGTSFYGQCVPSGTVHYGQVLIATHWLNNSNLVIKDSLYGNVSSDGNVRTLMKEAARRDWELFLCQRAKELAKGGILFCICLGDSNGVCEKFKLYPMNTAWEKLYSQGHISQMERENAVIQIVIRSEEEHKTPFLDQDSPVSKAGLRLIYFEECLMDVFKKSRSELINKPEDTKRKDLRMKLATKYSDFFKAIYHNSIYKCLGKERTEEERIDIMEKYFQLLTMEYFEDENLLDFKPNHCFHAMIIRKE